MLRFLTALLLCALSCQLSAQTGCIQVLNCPSADVNICDQTPNNLDFWHENNWNDPVYADQDLRETPIDLNIIATSTCGATLNIQFELLLDLTGDGIQETSIKSNNLPASNTIPFNNISGPTEIRAFDQRAVASNGKFGFTKQDSTAGNQVYAFVRWNTQSAPNAFAVPEIPLGIHKIRWTITDNLSNQSICEYYFIVRDCKKPTVVCLNGLSVNIMPTGMIQLWAPDFLQYTEDNATPTNQLQIAVRKKGTGTGFPADGSGNPINQVIYNCSEIGTQLVELWSKDKAGNTDYCETYVLVQDNMSNCDTNSTNITVCAKTWNDQSPIAGVYFGASQNGNTVPPFAYTGVTGPNGCGTLPNIPANAVTSIVPFLDTDPLNGVDVYDLIKISKHILGISSLPTYGLIAADINKSGSISTFDIVETRRLLLGVYAKFPNNNSWRFVDAAYTFPNPQNPFQAIIPETIAIINQQPDSTYASKFIGIKIGDVDGSAVPGLKGPDTDDRAPAQAISLQDRYLKAGEIVEVPLFFSKSAQWLGFQFGLEVQNERLQLLNVQGGQALDLNQEHFSLASSSVHCVWANAQPIEIQGNTAFASLQVQAKEEGWLHDALNLSPSEQIKSLGYTQDERKNRLELIFNAANQAPGQATVSYARPNPTTGNALIPIELDQKSSLQLEVFGLDGKLQWSQKLDREKGVHSLEIPAIALPQTGIYTWRLLVNGQLYQGKIVRA